ncbi:MAG: hypothetical protein WAQ98_24525 [Blastocatellia bacterium]
MPGGIENPVLGYATFAAIKLVGYSAMTYAMARAYKKPGNVFLLAGITRTLIGLVVGAVYGLIMIILLNISPTAVAPLFVIGLFFLRLGEWGLLIWLFFDRPLTEKSKDILWIILGTVLSFFLDAPAFIGAIVTAGVWIC